VLRVLSAMKGRGQASGVIQRYAVGAPRNASCAVVVSWLNRNSPHRPAWALTRARFSFSDVEFNVSGTAPDFTVTMSGKVSVRKTVDMPMWRPNSPAMQTAWDEMWAELRAHESKHEGIADDWKATMQERLDAWSADISAPNRAAARREAVRRFEADKASWVREQQADQNAIDPFFATLNCP
jgi:hypothetical protein